MISSRSRHRAHNNDLESVRRLRLCFIRGEQPPTLTHRRHILLHFLVECKSVASNHTATSAGMNAIYFVNSRRMALTREQLTKLYHGIAMFVMDQERPMHVIEYLAGFFAAKEGILARCTRPVDTSRYPVSETWMAWPCVRRALIVPDMRRLALEIQWKMEVRPGEFEMIKRIRNASSCSAYTVVTALRTVEFITRVRMGLMYGSLEDLNQNGWLNAFLLAMIQTRMQSRSGFDWMQSHVEFEYTASTIMPKTTSMLVTKHVTIVAGTPYKSVTSAFARWCRESPTTLHGRYDITMNTI